MIPKPENSRPLENIGAVIIVLHPDRDKILIGERKNSYKAGWYGMPGGRVEFAESVIDAATRELEEETSLIAYDLSYIGVVREQQENNTFIHFGYVTKAFEGEPKTVEPEKCVGWEWRKIDELPENILPGHKGIIDIFLSPEKVNFRDVLLEQS